MRIFLFLILLAFTTINAQNGIIKTTNLDGSLASEESYIDDVYDGTSYWYFKNGNIKVSKDFDRGKLHGWVKYYWPTGLIKKSIQIKNGIRDGFERNYYENGALKSMIKYNNGKRVKIVNFDPDPTFKAPVEKYQEGNRQSIVRKRKKQEIYCSVNICPEPIGGMQSIEDNIIYPEAAKLYGLEGIVKVVARIDTLGNAIEAYVTDGIGLGCDEAAIEAVKSTQFIPGKDEGKLVQTDVILKIIFALDVKTKLKLARQDIGETKKVEAEKKIPKNGIECEFEQCAKPKNGIAAIIEKIEMPSVAKRLNVNGKVVIEAVVGPYGFVKDTKVISGLGYGVDESVESAIFSTEFWPAEQNGNPIESKVTLTILVEMEK